MMNPDGGYNFLDTIDWCVIGNLCIARFYNVETKRYTFEVAVYDGVGSKFKKDQRESR